MNQYIIIFTNNDGLKEFYQHIGNDEANWVNQQQMCFLPGNGDCLKFKNIKEFRTAAKSGVYLFYDGDQHGADYNKRDILAAIRHIKKEIPEMYLCYHLRNMEKIVSEIDRLGIKWANAPLTRHHYQLPYSLLADYFNGGCTIAKLTEVWATEDAAQLFAQRKLLEYALRDASRSKLNVEHESFHDVVRGARLNEEQQIELESFVELVKTGASKKEIKLIKEKLVLLLKNS